ncbi:MAG: Rv3654c family TadE-like protein [Nocardioidaceae bacterium]
MPPSRSRAGEERGIGTVWAVTWILCLLSIGWLALVLVMAVAEQHHLDGSADMVSLSAANQLDAGGDACAVAERVAEQNDVELLTCTIEGDDVFVSVGDVVGLPWGIDGHITSSSRAGPDGP